MFRKLTGMLVAVAIAAVPATASAAYVLAVSPSGSGPLDGIDIQIEDSNGTITTLHGSLKGGVGFMMSGVSAFGKVKVKRSQDAANWRECIRVTSPFEIPANATRVNLSIRGEVNNENRQDPYQLYSCGGEAFQ
ncbi:hypothetical protein EDC65_1121 [Stella humosa]|uniref:Secreted protein n=2 Tax=Stella humosa TaxID=94 RepID=A0A3N1M312_9PROT|nr:hypothetical protein EDC65_1121 [Stella humosa]